MQEGPGPGGRGLWSGTERLGHWRVRGPGAVSGAFSARGRLGNRGGRQRRQPDAAQESRRAGMTGSWAGPGQSTRAAGFGNFLRFQRQAALSPTS